MSVFFKDGGDAKNLKVFSKTKREIYIKAQSVLTLYSNIIFFLYFYLLKL